MYADGDNTVRVITNDEESNSDVSYARLQRSVALIKSFINIWDVQSSPHLPFVASTCTALKISNTYRTLRFHKPAQVTLFTLGWISDENSETLVMRDTKSQPGHPLATGAKGQMGLCTPALNLHRVTWNPNPGREFEIASGGRMGFVRIESVKRLKD